jgi:hypothetical protein
MGQGVVEKLPGSPSKRGFPREEERGHVRGLLLGANEGQVQPHESALTGSLPNFGFGKLSYGRYGRRESIVGQVENILTDIRLWSLRLGLDWTS